jgi:predicted N-acetyltransferase YhbS
MSADTCDNGSMTGVYFQMLSMAPLAVAIDSEGLTIGAAPGGVAHFRPDG